MTTQSTKVVSLRYQRLLECLPIALEKCHSKLDVEYAIRLCYGGDTDDDDGNDVFCSMLRDNIHQ
jgi:hypothetical protein